MIPTGDNKIVLTKWIAEIWEHSDSAKNRSEQKDMRSDDHTGFKQTLKHLFGKENQSEL